MKALRIYLMVCREPTDWDISLYQDITTLMDAWESARVTAPNCSALVHIGFDRPETTALSELLVAHPQRVLVTASARWALPPAFQCMHEPVGVCAVSDGNEAMPIYLGTVGWGYVIEPISRPTESTIPTMSPPILGEPEGWLVKLKALEPEMYVRLSTHGICNDAQYLQKRSGLHQELRLLVDAERFRYLQGSIDKLNPIAILEIAPLMVLESPVACLLLTVRVENVLRANNIHFIKDILSRGYKRIMQLPNFGLRSAKDLSRAILDFIASIIPDDRNLTTDADKNLSQLLVAERERETKNELLRSEEDIHASTLAGNLFKQLTDTISALPQTARTVMQYRLAIHGQRLTLEKISKKVGVTRERIRQIEAKNIKEIMKSNLWSHSISLKIDTLLVGREQPLYLDLLETEDSWFCGFIENMICLGAVIETFTSNLFNVFSIDNRYVVTRISKDGWESLKSNTKVVLREKIGQRWSEADVKLLIESMAHDKGASELVPLLLKTLATNLHFVESPNKGGRVLVAFGKSVEQLVITVLEESDAPLHYTEIYRRVQEIAEREIDLRRVHVACKSCGGKLFARGTYGLMKHCPVPEEEIEDLLAEIEDILLTNPEGKQWHCAELVELLAERRPDMTENVTPYVLNLIMERSRHLVYLGRLVWAVRSGQGSATTDRDRIDMAQACISLLKQAGRPLSIEDLKEKLSRVRGIHPKLQLHMNDQLISVAPGIWGLRVRDVALSEEESRVRLDAVFTFLNQRRKALHVSEIGDVLKAAGVPLPQTVTPYSMFSLANMDPRFRMARGQFLALKEWTDLGRMTLSQAILRVVFTMADPLSFDEILDRIRVLTERNVEPMTVANLLRSAGLIFDAKSERWKIPAQETVDDDGVNGDGMINN